MKNLPTVVEPTIPELLGPWLQLALTGLLVLFLVLFVAVQILTLVSKARAGGTTKREPGKRDRTAGQEVDR